MHKYIHIYVRTYIDTYTHIYIQYIQTYIPHICVSNNHVSSSALGLCVCNSTLFQASCLRPFNKLQSRVMAKAVSRRPLTTKFRFLSQAIPCAIFAGQCGTETVYFLNPSFFSVCITPPKSHTIIAFIFYQSDTTFTVSLSATTQSLSAQDLCICTYMRGQ